MVRAGLLVLACAFSSAGHAQLQARDLDHAVGELVRTLVNEGRLSGQKVYVGADDFFEEENELRPPLSKILRTMCLRALTDRQVEVALVPAEAVQVLHGRWRRESETNLHLTLFVADPPRDQDEPVATRSADALVPVEGLRPRDIEPTLRHWGDRVVRRLERDLPGSGRFRLHLSPFPVQDEALSEKFGRYLVTNWRPAFTASDRFRLVGSAQSAEGVLHGDVFVAGGRVEVGLSILDREGSPVASDHVALEHSLFPSGMVGGGGPVAGTECGSLSSVARRLRNELGREFSPDASTEEGWTDLHYAAVLNLPELAECMLRAGAFVDSRTRSDVGSFSDGLQQTLLTFGHDLINFGWTPDNRTPLHWAAIKGASEVVDVLLDNGADANAADFSHNTPLHATASVRSSEMAAKLIRAGASANASNFRGDTPLHWAANRNAYDVADVLIHNGADVNASNTERETPLHNVDDARIARLLIDSGADVNARNSDGETRLCKFLGRGDTPISRELENLLIDNGAERCPSSSRRQDSVGGNELLDTDTIIRGI